MGSLFVFLWVCLFVCLFVCWLVFFLVSLPRRFSTSVSRFSCCFFLFIYRVCTEFLAELVVAVVVVVVVVVVAAQLTHETCGDDFELA